MGRPDLALPGVTVEPDAWIRKDDTGRALAIILSGFVTLIGAVLVLIGAFAGRDDSLATFLAVEAMFVSLTAAFAWLTVRLLFAGVRIGQGEVRMRGMLRTRRMPLAEVDRFEPGVFSSVPLHDEIGVRILRRGGRRGLDVWALGGGQAHDDDALEAGLARLEPLCEELNALLDEARGDTAVR